MANGDKRSAIAIQPACEFLLVSPLAKFRSMVIQVSDADEEHNPMASEVRNLGAAED